MAIKQTMLLGTTQRNPIVDPSEAWPAHVKYSVRSQTEYESALNNAYAGGYSVIVLDKPGLQVQPPVIQGRTTAKEIIHHGGHGEQTEGLYGTTGQVLGLFGSNKFGFSNLHGDGRDGHSQKGVVMGAATDGDGRTAPANDIWFDHFEMFGVQAQLMKHSGGSRRIKLTDVDLHDNGVNSSSKYREGSYWGEGSRDGTTSGAVQATRLCVYNIDGGEAFDIKDNTHGFRVDGLDIENVSLRYSGALTAAIGNFDVGHDADLRFVRVCIRNVRSLEHIVSGVQTGVGMTLDRFYIAGIRDGYGVQLLDHGVRTSENKVTLSNGVIGTDGRQSVRRGGSTLSDKSKAVSPLELDMFNVLTDDDRGTGPVEQWTGASLLFGDGGLPLPPVVITPPTPTPPPPAPPAPVPPAGDIAEVRAKLEALTVVVETSQTATFNELASLAGAITEMKAHLKKAGGHDE